MNPHPNDVVPDQTHSIHNSFLTAFQHLARESVPGMAAEWPEITQRHLAGLLIALGSAATIMIQSHMQDLAPAHHNLIIQCGTGSDVSLAVEDPTTGCISGLTVWLIWRELLFSTPDARTLRPAAATLIREHVLSPLYRNEEEQLIGFCHVLGETLSTPPYSNALRRLAHLPVLLLEVAAESVSDDPVLIEREAQRRLTQLYGQKEEINVYLEPESVLKA